MSTHGPVQVTGITPWPWPELPWPAVKRTCFLTLHAGVEVLRVKRSCRVQENDEDSALACALSIMWHFKTITKLLNDF